MKAIDALRQPLALPTETLPNRLAKSAISEGLADSKGRPTAELVRLYEAWARGGAGLLVTGNVMVERRCLERPGNIVLDKAPDAEMKALLAGWVEAARRQGAGFWMQLSHPGRQTPRLVNAAPKAPSAVPLELPGKQFGAPVSLTPDEIEMLIERFADAAVYAREAGFTGVQIQAAHGDLLSQFLSPRSNRRTDGWGGAVENRARFLLHVVRRVRAKVGRDYTVSVKLNSSDFQRGGFDGGESLLVAGWLVVEGVTLIEVSGGNVEQPRMLGREGLVRPVGVPRASSIAAREAYFLEFAKELRRSVALPVMVSGGFRTAEAMIDAVAAEGMALVGLGRPMCVDPLAVAKLFAGQAALERYEAHLTLGGGLLGPRSPLGIIKTLNDVGSQYWYYQQLRRVAEGRAPQPGLKLRDALKAERAAQAQWLAGSGAPQR
jgi:2,4-dienoyl-CoA reductase-like NADH-dependent reductase (Old Yellow Enzyme family)